MALGVIEGKEAAKIEVLVIFCVFSEKGIQYFDSIIIHLGLVINRPVANNNEKFRSFKSKENIHKKEVGPYRSFSY